MRRVRKAAHERQQLGLAVRLRLIEDVLQVRAGRRVADPQASRDFRQRAAAR
jgi:hypothetical protein